MTTATAVSKSLSNNFMLLLVDLLVKLRKKDRAKPGLFNIYVNFNITARPDLELQFRKNQHWPLVH